ncbi:MAG TPA: polysaccharide biosynthesis tyrosine autokinase [Flavitalea sp.]|nr:polysaccharide biosynthesis tyrosine autokinase [Flavitalea sp.]
MEVTTKEFFEDELDSSEKIFQKIFYKYLPYWPLFLGLLIIGVIGGLIYLRYATPIFETSAKILVKDEKKGLDESKILESFDLLGSKKIVENEIEVIKSVQLVSKVVKNLHLYAAPFQQGSIKDFSAYAYSPVRIEFKEPDLLVTPKDEEKIFFHYDSIQQKVTLDNQIMPLNSWATSPYGTLRFVNNDNYTKPKTSKKLYFTITSVNDVTNDLLERLDVESTSKLASIIYLRLQDAVSARAENILNELIRVYDMAGIEDKNALAANTLSFVLQKLKLVESDLDSVESQIQKYKLTHRIVDMSEQGKLFLESAEKNNELIKQNNVQRAVLDEIDQYISGGGGKNISISTLGVVDPVLSQLLGLLYESEMKFEGIRNSTGEKNTMALAMSSEIEMLKSKIRANVQTQRKSLLTGGNVVSDEQQKYSTVLKKIPSQEKELIQISRQQSIKNTIYTFLLQKKEETELSLASTIADTRLVDHAHSTTKPVSPNKPLILILSGLIALVLGLIFIYLKDVLNRNISSKVEVETLCALPVLGEIALSTDNNKIVMKEGSRMLISEQFRQIRTALRYIGINSKNKKILVTSGIPGEGKSFVAANLGIALSLTGKKVVLIELDLRKPTLSVGFDVKRSGGLTNYLIGENISIQSIIKPLKDYDSLFLIPSGPIPPNPSELISHSKLTDLLLELEKDFDYVIIDTAPVGPVTDAYILSPFCDATLYIVRQGITPKALVSHLEKKVRYGGLKNVGIIVNGVSGRGIGKYGYGKSYEYSEYGNKAEIQ